jgi:hypothetical protein
MDGEALGHKIARHPELYGAPKRILVTGMGRKRSATFLKQAGFSGTLLKPILRCP